MKLDSSGNAGLMKVTHNKPIIPTSTRCACFVGILGRWTRDMSKPKRIVDVSISDLEAHRWCYYHNDDLGFDAFEHVIPDTHPDFSSDVIELELADFVFANGKILKGVYDGSESFTVDMGSESLSFWRGIAKPLDSDLNAAKAFLSAYELAMPVKVLSKWSKRQKTINGLEYINSKNEVVSVVI
jgi:hypothetical protein